MTKTAFLFPGESFQSVGMMSAMAEPVIQNADVRVYHDAEQIREALARQLWQPVRWTETILSLVDSGVNRFIECGPGGVLSGLNRVIAPDSAVFALTGKDIMYEALQVEVSDE